MAVTAESRCQAITISGTRCSLHSAVRARGCRVAVDGEVVGEQDVRLCKRHHEVLSRERNGHRILSFPIYWLDRSAVRREWKKGRIV